MYLLRVFNAGPDDTVDDPGTATRLTGAEEIDDRLGHPDFDDGSNTG